MKLSSSSIKYFRECPFKYYLKYQAKIKVPMKRLPLLFGEAIHTAIEAIERGRDPQLEFLFIFKKDKLLEEEKDKYEEATKEGERMIKKYFKEKEYLEKTFAIKGKESERFFEVRLIDPISQKESSGTLSGRIDRITKENDLVEFKTSKKKFDQLEINRAPQATAYCFAQYLLTRKDPIKITYVIFIKGRKYPEIQCLQTRRSTKEYSTFFVEFEDLIKEIQNENFKAKIGFHCGYCEYKEICPYQFARYLQARKLLQSS